MNAARGNYLQYWGLRGEPFADIPDPDVYYPFESHSWALSLLEYAIREHKAAGLLTGAYGAGKTTTIRVLLGNISSEDFATAVVDAPGSEGGALFGAILERAEESATGSNADDLCDRLEAHFADNKARGKHNIVVVDEAQSLPAATLHRELRPLLDPQHGDHKLMTLLLVGQDELWQRVSQVPRLADRFAVKCRLQELDRAQTVAYVGWRIERSGGDPAIFADEALRLIHEASKGIPRQINSLCELCLVTGCRRNATVVDASLVKSARV